MISSSSGCFARALIAWNFTYIDILKPYQKSPFDLSSYPDKITPSSYKLGVNYQVTADPPFEGLVILGYTDSIDSLGYHKIVGEIKNNGAAQATYVEVICTYYDSAGKVIGTAFTFTPYDISVGDTAPFELSSYPRKLTPASYELQVQGQYWFRYDFLRLGDERETWLPRIPLL